MIHARPIASAALAPVLAILLASACSTGSDDERADDASGARFAAHAERFRELYGAGDPEGALAEAIAALEANPAADEPWVWVSKLHTDLGRDEDGIRFFEAWLAGDPDVPRAWFYRGYHEYQLSRLDEAAISFHRAAELDPADAESRYRLGLVLRSLGRFSEAAEAFRRSYEIDPGDARKARTVVDALRVGGDYPAAERIVNRAERYAEAEASLRRAIELDPRLSAAYPKLARVLSLLGRADEAEAVRARGERLADYERARRNVQEFVTDPRDPVAPMLMAEIELTESRFGPALDLFDRALGLGGPAARIAAGRAEALFRAGNLDAGAAALEPVEDRGDPRAQLALAARAVLEGDRARAVALATAAADRGPDEREFLHRAADLLAAAGADSATLRGRAAAAPFAYSFWRLEGRGAEGRFVEDRP
jgi:tetratricopeptide (TPR) repeat protein